MAWEALTALLEEIRKYLGKAISKSEFYTVSFSKGRCWLLVL
jgi:hypothetical protein